MTLMYVADERLVVMLLSESGQTVPPREASGKAGRPSSLVGFDLTYSESGTGNWVRYLSLRREGFSEPPCFEIIPHEPEDPSPSSRTFILSRDRQKEILAGSTV
jgi:hypothetical protein